MLQKVQYDAAGKLSVRSSSNEYFSIIKSHHPVLKEKKPKINKVIILDTKKLKNRPNAGKSGQGVALWVKVTQEP